MPAGGTVETGSRIVIHAGRLRRCGRRRRHGRFAKEPTARAALEARREIFVVVVTARERRMIKIRAIEIVLTGCRQIVHAIVVIRCACATLLARREIIVVR